MEIIKFKSQFVILLSHIAFHLNIKSGACIKVSSQ